MEYKVSIIMGIYNCATTLSEAIDSILNQTYTGWRLIMCDDGSSDNTYMIAKKYEQDYPYKIILLKNESNKGLNYTLNRCLEHVDTEYVARMDGDDISLPTRLEKELDFLENHSGYAIVSMPMIYFDENGEWGRGNIIAIPEKKSFAKESPFCHAPCMVRKEAFDAVNGYTVEKKMLRMEDYDLWIKMYASGYKGYNIPEYLYMMRDDRNATNRRKYRFRINEARVRIKAIKVLKLSFWNYIYVLRPLVVGLLPNFIYEYLHKKQKQIT